MSYLVKSKPRVNCSKTLKTMWFCGFCNSHDVRPVECYGQKSFSCGKCNQWGPWKQRIIMSRSKYHKHGLEVKNIRGWKFRFKKWFKNLRDKK